MNGPQKMKKRKNKKDAKSKMNFISIVSDTIDKMDCDSPSDSYEYDKNTMSSIEENFDLNLNLNKNNFSKENLDLGFEDGCENTISFPPNNKYLKLQDKQSDSFLDTHFISTSTMDTGTLKINYAENSIVNTKFENSIQNSKFSNF
jgi:hypothetical protein